MLERIGAGGSDLLAPDARRAALNAAFRTPAQARLAADLPACDE